MRKYIGNIGDRNILTYGGVIVYREYSYDKTYDKILIVKLTPNDHDNKIERRWGTLDKCTYVNGVLSDNSFHIDKPAWFADDPEWYSKPAEKIVNWAGATYSEFIDDITSNDPMRIAARYVNVYDYYGWDNFDSYPTEMNRTAVWRFHGAAIRKIQRGV